MGLYYPPFNNGLQKFLNAQLDQGVTSQMTLNNTTGIQNKPGVCVIDRIDSAGQQKSTAVREYISYTGISGNNLTGLTRGLGGSTDQDHLIGAVVEFIPDITVFQAINDTITTEHTTSGNHTSSTVTTLKAAGTDVDTGTEDAKIVTPKAIADSYLGGGGWKPANETWNYASADDPVFTFTITGDKTDKYSAGMRIKLTQTTGGTKYFIIVNVAYSNPNTTITVYGGTDYDLNNETISNPFYSNVKVPFGFPLDPSKWSVIVKNSNDAIQTNAIAGTWYNPSSQGITIPIGCWRVDYQTTFKMAKNATTNINGKATLSTSNNSETDTDFTIAVMVNGASGNLTWLGSLHREKILTLTTKTQYYLNVLASFNNLDEIGFQNSYSPTIIRAICAYL